MSNTETTGEVKFRPPLSGYRFHTSRELLKDSMPGATEQEIDQEISDLKADGWKVWGEDES